MKEIDLFLSGGGVKCAYQITLLETLTKNKFFNENFKIRNIYCVSFGSYVGFALINNKLDELKKLFLSFNQHTLIKSFRLWGINLPIIGRIINYISNIIWVLYSISNKGFYLSDIGYNILNKLGKNINNNNLINYNVFTYNVTKQSIELINGLNAHTKEHGY